MASSEVVEVLVSAPDLVRVVAGPAVVARETPSPEGRAIGAVPEGAVVQVSRVVFEAQKSNASRADVVLLAHTGPPRRAQVAGRNPQGWLRLSGGGRDAWIPERGEENELAARPVLPALFEVASEAGVEVRSHPTDQGGEARLVLRPGEVFDAISCEGDWLKVYHGREAEPLLVDEGDRLGLRGRGRLPALSAPQGPGSPRRAQGRRAAARVLRFLSGTAVPLE